MSAKCQKRTLRDVPKLCLIDPQKRIDTEVDLARARYRLPIGPQTRTSRRNRKTPIDRDQRLSMAIVPHPAGVALSLGSTPR